MAFRRSRVRSSPSPPRRSKVRFAPTLFYQKASSARFLAPPFPQKASAEGLGFSGAPEKKGPDFLFENTERIERAVSRSEIKQSAGLFEARVRAGAERRAILSVSTTSSQASYRLRRRFFIKTPSCAHSAAPPLTKKPRRRASAFRGPLRNRKVLLRRRKTPKKSYKKHGGKFSCRRSRFFKFRVRSRRF